MFQGSIVALVTPFTQEGEIDFNAFEHLIEAQIAAKSDGILLCGTTGEGSTLSYSEKLQLFRKAIEMLKGKMAIIANTGTQCTRETLHLTQEAKQIGVDGCLIITPYYNRPTAQGCYQHYEALCKLDIPLIVYYNPIRTALKLTAKDLARICTLPNIVGIKDASGDLDYSMELMQKIQIPLLAGNDTLTLPLMAMGASGVISVLGNLLPAEFKQVITLCHEKKFDEAKHIFFSIYPLASAMCLETNPQCVKWALHLTNKCSPILRLPLIEPSDTSKQQISVALDALSACHF